MTNTNMNASDVSREICENAYHSFGEFEKNLRVVKAVLFKKSVPFKGTRYITVLCTVPSHSFGDCKLIVRQTEDGTIKRPTSAGTFIRVLGDSSIITPRSLCPISFTEYSAYLNSIGYHFALSVKSAYGENASRAFQICKMAIDVIRQIRR